MVRTQCFFTAGARGWSSIPVLGTKIPQAVARPRKEHSPEYSAFLETRTRPVFTYSTVLPDSRASGAQAGGTAP